MTQRKKRELAIEVIREAESLGIKPVLHGSWVVWKPPLPIDLMCKAMRCQNEIAALAEQTAQQDQT